MGALQIANASEVIKDFQSSKYKCWNGQNDGKDFDGNAVFAIENRKKKCSCEKSSPDICIDYILVIGPEQKNQNEKDQ